MHYFDTPSKAKSLRRSKQTISSSEISYKTEFPDGTHSEAEQSTEECILEVAALQWEIDRVLETMSPEIAEYARFCGENGLPLVKLFDHAAADASSSRPIVPSAPKPN